MTNDDAAFGGWRACDICGEPIATIEEAALALRSEALDERRAAASEAAASGVRAPGLAAWDWGHAVCFSGIETAYLIAGPRFDTMPKLVARTLQLLDEEWFLDTAWEDAVRRFYRIPFE